jgi:aldehyde dehydrogenase (NAD+)
MDAPCAPIPADRAVDLRLAHVLLTIADVLEEDAEEVAVLTAADTGNALRSQARPETAALVSLFRYSAESPRR